MLQADADPYAGTTSLCHCFSAGQNGTVFSSHEVHADVHGIILSLINDTIVAQGRGSHNIPVVYTKDFDTVDPEISDSI